MVLMIITVTLTRIFLDGHGHSHVLGRCFHSYCSKESEASRIVRTAYYCLHRSSKLALRGAVMMLILHSICWLKEMAERGAFNVLYYY